ncbi:MAG: hypothetical protein M1822_003603 [Bathelium mastoideum]|nr:MAG: hypothetical protein M1822_003603 [Bathelium mastoideum]
MAGDSAGAGKFVHDPSVSSKLTLAASVTLQLTAYGGRDDHLFQATAAEMLDYDFVTDYTYRAYANGAFVHVPAIYGDDTNEGTIFTPNYTSTIGQSNVFLKDQFPGLTLQQLANVNQLYPVEETPSFVGTGRYWRQVSNAYGEIRYICPGIFISEKYAELQLPIWNYHWDVIDPTDAMEGLGVTHTVEVNAIWGPTNVNGGGPISYNTTNAPIVPVVQAYWTSFVRSHNPNTYRLASTPKWAEFGSGKERLHFVTNATAMETVPQDQRDRCSYLNGIGLSLTQ